MIQIKPIPVGFPAKEANAISVRLMPFQTTAKDCSTYYELFAVSEDSKEKLAEGNCPITEEQYANWGADNAYIEDCVLKALGLERF